MTRYTDKIYVVITSEGGGGHLVAAKNIKDQLKAAGDNCAIETFKVLSEEEKTSIRIGNMDFGQQGVKGWNYSQKNDSCIHKIFATQWALGLTNYMFGSVFEKDLSTSLENIQKQHKGKEIIILDCQPLFTLATLNTIKKLNIKSYKKVLTDCPEQAVHFMQQLEKIKPENYKEQSITIEMLQDPSQKNNIQYAKHFLGNLFAQNEQPYSNITFEFTEGPIKKHVSKTTKEESLNTYSIMLGSQASNDILLYIEALTQKTIKNPTQQFTLNVFCGNNDQLKQSIYKMHNTNNLKINAYGFVSNDFVLDTYAKSNSIIIRPGGLSVMEALHICRNTDKKVYVTENFSTQWEKGNYEHLKKALATQVELCSPNTIFSPPLQQQNSINNAIIIVLLNIIINLLTIMAISLIVANPFFTINIQVARIILCIAVVLVYIYSAKIDTAKPIIINDNKMTVKTPPLTQQQIKKINSDLAPRQRQGLKPCLMLGQKQKLTRT